MTDATQSHYAAFILRIGLGAMALAHGLLKIFVFTIPGTVGYFASLGYPAVMAYAVIAAEVLGGLALIAGIGTRYVSLALVPVLIGATMTHAGNGWVFSSENGGWEFPAFWTVTLLVQTLLGNGAFALEPMLAGRRATMNA